MRIPYGFTLTNSGGLETNKSEAENVALIFNFYMAGALNLCFSIFKGFLLSAPFFRVLRRLDFGKIEEKSFTKLWALDCWF